MLTTESLIEHAKLRGMPTTKMRGILREYLQILILKEIYRQEAGRKLYFTGGTYLRLAHDLKRFSENLDFNTGSLTEKGFFEVCQKVSHELKRLSIASHVIEVERKSLYVAQLVFPTIETSYGVVSKYSKKKGIVIKVESNKPKWKIKTETKLVTGFGETYPCICTDRGALFADKVDALQQKNMGRHIYDIVFMLSNKFPLDHHVLSTLGIRQEPSEALLEGIRRFPKTELKKLAEALRPFLFDEKEADWLIQAPDLIPDLLQRYKL